MKLCLPDFGRVVGQGVVGQGYKEYTVVEAVGTHQPELDHDATSIKSTHENFAAQHSFHHPHMQLAINDGKYICSSIFI